jgi:DNA-binding SARP family transcriptional activator
MSAVALSAKVPEVAQLDLLGGFRLRHAEVPIRVQPNVQRLLAFLAIHGRPLQRLYVAGRLWTESSQETANANLRTALWRLRHPDRGLIEVTTKDVALAAGVVIDVREATDLAQRVLAGRAQDGDVAALIAAGELLPDLYDDWIVIERERFRQLRLHALERLCEQCRNAGRFADAVEAGLAAIATEPLRESAHRVLISSYVAEGNLSEARRDYRSYCNVARKQLGVGPSPRLRGLIMGAVSERRTFV